MNSNMTNCELIEILRSYPKGTKVVINRFEIESVVSKENGYSLPTLKTSIPWLDSPTEVEYSKYKSVEYKKVISTDLMDNETKDYYDKHMGGFEIRKEFVMAEDGEKIIVIK